MIHPIHLGSGFDEHLDCFGDYSKDNPLCAKYCALRLGCAVQKEHNIRMEILSDLSTNEERIDIIQ
ncbi:MAG: hypothetical protein M0036_00545 [Desulfobacteraceae bacterium]|nr:hypothetical protein [Desulfobacteraceae bacterium]